jgi:hypothetical protein
VHMAVLNRSLASGLIKPRDSVPVQFTVLCRSNLIAAGRHDLG